jgi:hypothetical protein
MATAPKLVAIRPRPAKHSPLTPELKEFIDRAIVPALVKQYLAANEPAKGGPKVKLPAKQNDLAESEACVAQSLSSTATPSLRGR